MTVKQRVARWIPVAAGCGLLAATLGVAPDVQAAAPKPVTISVYLGPLAPTDSLVKSVANPYPQDALDQLAKAYERMHPNVHIDVLPQVPMTGNAYLSREDTWFASHSEPDIIWVQGEAATLGPEGDLVNLNPYLAKKDPYMPGARNWRSTLLTQGPNLGPQGQEYEVPLDVVATTFYYNKSILQKAHITKLPHTLGQFFQDCARIEKAHLPGVYPFYQVADPLNWWFYGIYGSAIQGNLVKECYWHGPKSGPLTPEETARAVYLKLVTTHSPAIRQVWIWAKQLADYGPPWDTTLVNQQADSLFVNGQLAFYWDGNWDYNYLKDAIGHRFAWGTMSLPVVSKKDYPTAGPMPLLGGANNNEAITANAVSQHVLPEAINFLQYLSSPRPDTLLTEQGTGGNIPNVKGAPVQPSVAGFLKTVESSNTTGFFDFGIGPNITDPNVQGVLEAYLKGEISLNTALNKAEALWIQENNQTISQNQHGPKSQRWNIQSWKS
ncbi:MAG: ABC transporter substrate-binding protein [Firmicutes bacterium]|nr:ABC transporter substrate-binding protein [Bacillota bacterium]